MTPDVPVQHRRAQLLAEAHETMRAREPQARLRRALWAAGLVVVNLVGWGLFLVWLNPN